MEKRKLGSSTLRAAPWAFGGNVFGWTADEQASFRLLDAFTDAGFNLIDTADVYSKWVSGHRGGESETIIGKWLKQSGKRNQVLIATKVGGEMGPQQKGLTRAHIIRSVEDSLRRLQTDHIDLYQTHYDDEGTPVEETLAVYAELIRAGKVRIIGASNVSPERLKLSLHSSEQYGYPRYETLQPEYNLYDREKYERHYAPICKEHGLSVLPYYALASGFLTGKYRSPADIAKSPRGRKAVGYLNERGMRIQSALDQVAARYHTRPASVSIAWLAQRPGIAAPIASATSVEQLQDLVKAAALQLDREAVELLDEASRW